MNQYSSTYTRICGILLAALMLIPLMGAASAQERKGKELKPRKLAEKPQHTRLGAWDDASRIEVKFQDGLRFNVTPAGVLVERPQRRLRSGNSRATLARIISEGGRWHRMIAVPEEEMDKKRGNAQRNLGKEVADMNSYYILNVPEEKSAEEWIDMLNELPDVEIARPVPLPAPMPVPGDFEGQQDYLEAATDGIDANSYAWTVPGGTGANVRICDFEYSWNLDHQDLPSVTTLIPAGRTADDPFSSDDHGTAVLGEYGSIDNGWGTTGSAHDAQLFVAPVSWDTGYNLAAAITNAMSSLSAGDVMLIEQQTRGPNYIDNTSQFGLVPSEWQKSVYDAIVTAVGNGIHVVEAAGNGSQDLDGSEYSSGNGGHHPFDGSINSGAIIVGAGAPPTGSTTDRSRLGFSNYGSRVNLQGYGSGVMTTGYGGHYSAEGKNLWYTSSFSGTSSASPIVTGAVALVESIHEELNAGATVTPAAMRTLLMATGSPQQSGTNPASENIGPRPSILAAIQALEPCVLTCPADITVSNDADLCGAYVTYPAPVAGATCGTVTATPASGAFFPVGTTTVQVSTASGDDCSFTVTVNDTQKPSITCPDPIVVGNDPGECSAVVNFSATVSDNCPGVTYACSPPSGTAFPVGVTVVTCTATDAAGNTESCNFTVTVNDVEPPTIAVSVDPDTLWPPNHMMRRINATVTTTDNCPGESYVLTSIVSNEADNGLGDGDFPNDIQNASLATPDLDFRLRAERSGLGSGRVYTVTYTATDGAGNTTSADATVFVPFSMEKRSLPVGSLPQDYQLSQNYPNPFNPTTTIRYDIPSASTVTLRVFNALGREVAVLVSGSEHSAGSYEVTFDADGLGSGIYSYTLLATETGSNRVFSQTRNMVLMK
ncbi:MAG: HYR domain-containing protein [Bacteroidota bacterium]|nr:HYR domain-containing protein [Bacteroidota bacterium]